ncbi:MAG: HAMP domain-containing sensor histidine kinase [Planctomycetota bacterium]|nr:HAMP domain-containing sensor histidine kinase [Planctomycetota bacterium]
MESTQWMLAVALGGVVVALLCGIGVFFWQRHIRLRLRRLTEGIAQRDRVREQQHANSVAELSALGSGLAHEIKNPLSTLVLNAQLLREDILDIALPEDRGVPIVRRADALSREASRLKDILEDFLKYAGRMVLDRTPTDLGRLITDLADFVHPQCEQASIRLRVDLPDVAVNAEVDEGLLKQAILNLIVNAIQVMEKSNGATSPRELILRLGTLDQDSGERAIAIHVIDTGAGIPAERLIDIFRPYVSTKKTGSGLGLPTARRIAHEHGGTLEVHSTVGVGSDFTLTLPMA